MIRTVTKDNADRHVSHLYQMHLYQMHRIRKTAFNDRLGWDVTVERIVRHAGWELERLGPASNRQHHRDGRTTRRVRASPPTA
jgi:acyl homoserine lactone synthase